MENLGTFPNQFLKEKDLLVHECTKRSLKPNFSLLEEEVEPY